MQNLGLAVRAIQAGWNSSWLKSSLSTFTILGHFLKHSPIHEGPAFLYGFMNAYFESSSFIRSKFTSYIQNWDLEMEFDNATRVLGFMRKNHIFDENNFNAFYRHTNPKQVASALTCLHQADILTQDNFTAVAGHADPEQVASALTCLQQADILTQDNFRAVIRHPDSGQIARTLTCLQQADILTQNNFNAVAGHGSPLYIAWALSHLVGNAGILTQDNFNVVVGHANPLSLQTAFEFLNASHILTQDNFNVVAGHTRTRDLAESVRRLSEAGILIQDNFNVVVRHANPENLVTALIRLHRAGILTPENRNVVAGHTIPGLVGNALQRLHKAGILTSENRDVVAGHANPEALAGALSRLHEIGILTPENHGAVVRYGHPGTVASAVICLHIADFLTEDNFAALIDPAHQALLDPDTRQILWDRLGARHLRDNWVRILAAARQADPLMALATLTDQILGITVVIAANPVHAELNGRQSTHTASVHHSVSESATRLFSRYGAELDGSNLNTIIATITAWTDALPAGSINDAAKRCLSRITAPDYAFTDPSSDVSTRQLLALSWLAIHDETIRQGNLADALRQFCEGLYESQRGYNLSDQGVDEGGVDDPICTAGTFNKLVEKLEGIHPDVIIKHITPKIAGLKLPAVVKEEVSRYLLERTNPMTAAGFTSITARLKKVEEEGVSAIWDSIKVSVSTRMFDEFGSLYTNKDDARFTGLIDAGQYVNLGELPSFQKALSESEGYREYCSASMKSYGVFFKGSHSMLDHGEHLIEDGAPTPI